MPFVLAFSILTCLTWTVVVTSRSQQADKPSQAATPAVPSNAPDTHAGSSIGPSGVLKDEVTAAAQLFRTGKFAEAEDAYNAILQSNPKSTQAYIGLFRVLLRERRSAEAANILAKAAAMAPNSDAVRTAQGEMHFRQGQIQEAQADFTALVKAGTSEPRAYLGLARVYWAESLYQHAKLLFDMAHERDPDDPEIRKHWLFVPVQTVDATPSGRKVFSKGGVYETRETVWVFGGAETRRVASLEGRADAA